MSDTTLRPVGTALTHHQLMEVYRSMVLTRVTSQRAWLLTRQGKSHFTMPSNGSEAAGVGAEIAAIIAAEAFEDLDAPVTRVAAPDVPLFPYSSPLEEYCYPGRDKLEAEARRLLAY